MKRLAIGAGLLAVITAGLGVLGLTGIAEAGHYEEPEYTVVSTTDDYELRAYKGRIEARVTVQGSYGSSVQRGFRVLANYIFGGNQATASIDMTTPVSAVESQRIDMTTPVSAVGDGESWTIAFMMPSEWTLDTLPVPRDPRVELVQVAPQLHAVRTFRGRATHRRAERELDTLRAALDGDGREVSGEPSIAQFNPPWVLGPWRRNEVQLPVRDERLDG